MAEQKIVEMVRKILVNEKGYPDPANCDQPDKNGLIMYAQDDYKKNIELYNKVDGLLNHSSKCAEKAIQKEIWTDKVNEGKPEFIIINNNSNLAIVIECKPAAKTNNHISTYLKNDNVLVGRGDIISKYAVDGALHYAKFLSKKYNVIAIGISGIENSNDLKISTYYWEKDKTIFYEERETSKKGVLDKVCYGPFVNLKLEKLASYQFYSEFIDKESKKIIKDFNEEKATLSAADLNVMLDGAGVGVTVRALLISGLLLALRDTTFKKTYEDKDIDSKALQENLNKAIDRVIDNEDIQGDFKKKVLKDKFKDAFNQQDLLEDNAKKLRMILAQLHKTVYPCMTGDYSIDIIGKFYHEFLSYAPNSQNNGIKLTPTQVTDLFCKLIDLKITDTILDPCLGTGGFLISAMNKLYQMIEKMDESQIEDYFKFKLEEGKINEKQINEIKRKNETNGKGKRLTHNDVKQLIRKSQLVGCEADNIMYTLGCSNMILRGDGKSNIILGDCFKKEEEIKDFNATVGFMNPPYSGSAYSVMEFVEFLLKNLQKGSKAVVIVPTSAAHSDDYIEIRNRILKENTLLASMSMSLDLFKGIADTITCILVFKAGVPHDFSKNVYFGNWKEDGYYWHKILGMIPDKDKQFYDKTPEEYVEEWLKSYNNDDKKDDIYGCWRKLKKENEICKDEWLWEYFVDTDYSKLKEEDFEKAIKDFVFYQMKNFDLL